MKLVLDTNVWLDLLVFDDPAARHLRHGFEIVIDAACAAELERVLAYPFGKRTLSDGQRAGCLEECQRLSTVAGQPGTRGALPRCADPDDQKFLELAATAGADVLVTKDEALLRLGPRLPFRVARPDEL